MRRGFAELVAAGSAAALLAAGTAAAAAVVIAADVVVAGDATFLAPPSSSPGDDLLVRAAVVSTGGGTLTFAAGDDVVQEAGSIRTEAAGASTVRVAAGIEEAEAADGDRGDALQRAGSVVARGLALLARGNVAFTSPANDVDVLAGATAGETFAYDDADDVAVGSVAGITGLWAPRGSSVTLRSTGRGAIRFDVPLDGGFFLGVFTDGETRFTRSLGAASPLDGVNTDAGGATHVEAAVTTTGVQTYNDDTTLAGSTLRASGVVVGSFGGLSGTGVIDAPLLLRAGARFSPGTTGPGCFLTRDLSLSNSTVFVADLDGSAPCGERDAVGVRGTVTLRSGRGPSVLDVRARFAPRPGEELVLILNDGTDPVAGTFLDLPEGAVVGAGSVTFRITYAGGDGNDVALTALG